MTQSSENTEERDFGELLRAYREAATDSRTGQRVSQDKLIENLGVLEKGYPDTREAISRWETGARRPPAREVVIDIALVLGLSPPTR